MFVTRWQRGLAELGVVDVLGMSGQIRMSATCYTIRETNTRFSQVISSRHTLKTFSSPGSCYLFDLGTALPFTRSGSLPETPLDGSTLALSATDNHQGDLEC